MLIRLLVCAAMAGARLAELAYSRRNLEQSGPVKEGPWTRQTYPLIVALHTAVILWTLFRGKKVRWRWLLLLLAAQAGRVWVLRTLGSRWNVHAAVPRDMEVETGGPYAWVRHPNYAVVAVELFVLPMAFGLRRFAVLASVVNAILLSGRIREEEEALMELPGYPERFADKPRFFPGV